MLTASLLEDSNEPVLAIRFSYWLGVIIVARAKSNKSRTTWLLETLNGCTHYKSFADLTADLNKRTDGQSIHFHALEHT